MWTRGSDPELVQVRNEACFYFKYKGFLYAVGSLFTSALILSGSVSVASTRDLYGLDLHENRSIMDPLPCARGLISVLEITEADLFKAGTCC